MMNLRTLKLHSCQDSLELLESLQDRMSRLKVFELIVDWDFGQHGCYTEDD
jgi:hypothetical protein